MLDSNLQLSLPKFVRPQKYKILLIIRSSKLSNLLKLELSDEGYEIEVAHDGISGLLKCRETVPQLVILDWSISSFSGLDICYRLRSSKVFIPIIVLTTDRQISDLVAALDAGADDCLTQPFAMTEFLARIRVQLRKYQVQKASVLLFEDLRLNTLTREVFRSDLYIYLTTKEFALLEYLMAHPRQVLTRTQIIDRVWGYDFLGNFNIIDVYIRYLSLKLEENKGKRLIHTVRGIGYVLRESSR